MLECFEKNEEKYLSEIDEDFINASSSKTEKIFESIDVRRLFTREETRLLTISG